MKRWSLLELYALSICLASLVGLLICFCWFLHGIAALVAPERTIPVWIYEAHQSDERYAMSRSRERTHSISGDRVAGNGTALREEREASWRIELELMHHLAIQEIAANGVGVVVSAGFFWAFWRLACRTRIEDREWVARSEATREQ